MAPSPSPWQDHAAPPVLVAIPTRNRPADLDRCLVSLADVDYPNWSILVVDQSDDNGACAAAARRRVELPTALTYRRMRVRGSARARNLALDLAGDRIVAFLDDDCTVPPDWLRSIASVYGRYPAVSMLFGSLGVPMHLAGVAGYLPSYVVQREAMYGPAVGGAQDCGYGASMSVWPSRQRLPIRFDPHMGPGSVIGRIDDQEYALRAVAAGETVLETPHVYVLHHGARNRADGGEMRYYRTGWFGLGAAHLKAVRCGHVGAQARVRYWLDHYAPHAGDSPRGWWRDERGMMLRSYLAGMLTSLRFRVDRGTGLYAPRTRRRPIR